MFSLNLRSQAHRSTQARHMQKQIRKSSKRNDRRKKTCFHKEIPFEIGCAPPRHDASKKSRRDDRAKEKKSAAKHTARDQYNQHERGDSLARAIIRIWCFTFSQITGLLPSSGARSCEVSRALLACEKSLAEPQDESHKSRMLLLQEKNMRAMKFRSGSRARSLTIAGPLLLRCEGHLGKRVDLTRARAIVSSSRKYKKSSSKR